MHNILKLLFISPLLFTLGCAGLSVHRTAVETDPAKDTDVKGLRVQVAEPHTVVFVTREGSGKIVGKKSTAMLPSQRVLYDIDFRGGLFSKKDLAVNLHPDGTIKKVTFNRDQNLEELFKTLSDTAKKTGETLKEYEQAKAAAEERERAAKQAEAQAPSSP